MITTLFTYQRTILVIATCFSGALLATPTASSTVEQTSSAPAHHTPAPAPHAPHFTYITNGDGELTLDEIMTAVSHVVNDVANIAADPTNIVTIGSNVLDILASVMDVAMEAMRLGELPHDATMVEFLTWVEHKKQNGEKIIRSKKSTKNEVAAASARESIFDAVIRILCNFANLLANKHNPVIVRQQASHMLTELVIIIKESNQLRSGFDRIMTQEYQDACIDRIIEEAEYMWAQRALQQ